MLFTSNSNDDTGGPEDIINAVYSREPVTDVRSAVLGKPELRDLGNEYTNDYYVVVPLDSPAGVQISPFMFDLPEQPELEGRLGEIAGFYDVEKIDEIAQLEGHTVPINWVDGYPSADINELRGKGA